MKKNCAHLGTQLSSVHGKGKPVFDICFSSFLEIHYLTCFLKAFKSLARFQLPGGVGVRGGGVVLTLLSLKRLFLERNVPGKFVSLHYVLFLTQGMAPMFSATFTAINPNKSNSWISLESISSCPVELRQGIVSLHTTLPLLQQKLSLECEVTRHSGPLQRSQHQVKHHNAEMCCEGVNSS